MKGYFITPMYNQLLFMRLHYLQQGDHSIDDYMEEFQCLLARNDAIEVEDQLVGYLGGLQPSRRNVMSVHPRYIVVEFYQCAATIEELQ